MRRYLVEVVGGGHVLQASEYADAERAQQVALRTAARTRTEARVEVDMVIVRGPDGEVEWQRRIWRR